MKEYSEIWTLCFIGSNAAHGSNAAQGQDAPVPAVVRGRGRPRKNPHDANGNATQHNPPPAAGGLDDCHDFLVVVGQRFSWEL